MRSEEVGHASQGVIHKREKHKGHIKLVDPNTTSVKIDMGREEKTLCGLKLITEY